MKALVLGSNGYLGQNLTHWLVSHNFNTKGVDLADSFPVDLINNNTNFSYKKLDLKVKQNIEKLGLEEFDLIYILVAITGTIQGFNDYEKFITINEILFLNILNAYKQKGASGRLIFPSSRLIYKGKENTLLSEHNAKEAKTIYAVNKIACELILDIWSNLFEIPFTVFRICVPYGQLLATDYSYGTLGFMIKQASNDNEIMIYGDGKQKRTFTHIADICEIFGNYPLIESTKNKIVNIGGNDNISILDLAKLIAKKYNSKITFTSWPELDMKIESGDTMLSDSLLQSLKPYKYMYSLDKYLNQNN